MHSLTVEDEAERSAPASGGASALEVGAGGAGSDSRDLTARDPQETQQAQIDALADRLCRAMHECGVYYQPAAEGQNDPERLKQHARDALDSPGNYLAWHHLAKVADAWPNIGVLAWEAIVEAARCERRSGSRAASLVEASGASPMDRARFLVLREELAAGWEPRNGIEWSLIDQLAQAQTMQERWQEVLTQRLNDQDMEDCKDLQAMKRAYTAAETRFVYGEWVVPRVTRVEAIAEATEHVDRWGRTFQRVLRALRDLRRYSGPAVINNGGQVNVGQQQIITQAVED